MNLPEISIRRPVTAVMAILSIIVIGGVCFTRIGIDFFPDIEFPNVALVTTYEGAAPEEVETIVTRPLEEAVGVVQGVNKIKSFSQEGLSVIQVEFRWGTNLDYAAQDVQNSIKLAIDFMPDEVDRPLVAKSDMDMMPILYYGVLSSTERDLRNLRKIIEDVVEKRVENLSGVAAVTVSGGYEREILVEVDKDRLKAHNLSLDWIIQVIGSQNRNIPGGHLIRGAREFIVRTLGKYKNVDQIADTVLTSEDGFPVYVRDVAQVKDTHKELRSVTKTNLMPSIVFFVTKESGTNTVQVADTVNRELEKIGRILPPDIEIINVWDTSRMIRDSAARLGETARWGALIAMVILFVFLWNFRTTLTLAVSIPFAIIAAFVGIYSAGYTLNIITLSGLALGIGMIVDNSIVVLENIFRHVQEGKDRMEAARVGATEVTMAITASTLTTVIVFLPMVFAQGMTGELTKPLGLTVTFALIASLLVALTLVPMLASRIFKEQPRQRGAGFFEAVKGRYMGVIRFALRHRALVVLGAIVIFVFSLYLIGRAGSEFMPKLDEMYSTAMLRLPPGTSLQETSRFVGKIEKAVMEEPEFRSIISMTGLTESSKFDLAMGAGSGSVNESTIYYEIAPKTERERTGSEFMEVVRSKLPELVEGSMYFMQTTDYFTLGGERPVSVKLFGPDLGVLKERSDLLKERMAQMEGVVDLENSLKMGKPELQVEVDRDKASSMGISVSQVANTIETAFLGREVTKYREAGDEHDIRVRFSERDRESWKDLEDVLLMSPQGFLVNLSDIATVEEGRGPVKIDREDQERVAIVSADVFGRDIGSVMAELGNVLGEVPLPEGYYFQLGGSLEDMQEMMVTMVWTISLIILLVFMVMASQFESLFHPLSIITAVPFAIIGVALALILTGTTLSVMSFIGIMMLVGIVVNNGIVLIDYVNQLRAKGMERNEAIVQGGATRLRPILMTTSTTILALVPMAISRGEGAELFAPISITIFGGLLTSMVLTLLVVPTIYSLVDDLGGQVRKLVRRGA